ncbi:Polysialic acid biosynthesis protein P7 [compost metagenome]
MKIGVLTSSRADYGIYRPLLIHLQRDPEIRLEIIAFGSHLAERFGKTVSEIRSDNYAEIHEVNHRFDGDTPEDVSHNYASCVSSFASFWALNNDFDFVFALGDRFEMSAAVNALIPFSKKLVHFYAGDTTLGALDNIYRHQITLASQVQFVSTEAYAKRVEELLGTREGCKVIGNLSLLNLENIELLSIDTFQEKWGIDLGKPTILMTVHPETTDISQNSDHVVQLREVIASLTGDFQFLISPPNADASGLMYRQMAEEMQTRFPDRVFVVEHLGTQSYFTCMNYCSLMVGNTSSGILEAASFGIFVLNLGNRQEGRISSENVIHVSFDKQEIERKVYQYAGKKFEGQNIYEPLNALQQVKALLQKEIK